MGLTDYRRTLEFGVINTRLIELLSNIKYI